MWIICIAIIQMCRRRLLAVVLLVAMVGMSQANIQCYHCSYCNDPYTGSPAHQLSGCDYCYKGKSYYKYTSKFTWGR